MWCDLPMSVFCRSLLKLPYMWLLHDRFSKRPVHFDSRCGYVESSSPVPLLSLIFVTVKHRFRIECIILISKAPKQTRPKNRTSAFGKIKLFYTEKLYNASSVMTCHHNSSLFFGSSLTKFPVHKITLDMHTTTCSATDTCTCYKLRKLYRIWA